MRWLVALVLLAGCPRQHDSTCMVDTDCGGEVCARDGECLPASDVRSVKVSWTIRGMPANATNCSTTPDFYLQFDGTTLQDIFGYEPVPCMAGQFTIDKLPNRFQQVEIGTDSRTFDVTVIDSSGMATFNLYP